MLMLSGCGAGGSATMDARGDGPADAASPCAPTVPVLRKPMRNAYQGSVHVPGSLRPTFVWEPSRVDGANPITYELELASDASFTREVMMERTTTISYRPAADLSVRTAAPVG